MAGTLIGLDNHRDVFLQGQAFDDRGDATDADIAATVDDFIVRGDRDQNAVFLKLYRGGCFGLVDLDAGLFDKHGGDNKEDQQNEDHIDHRREVDFDLVSVFGC